MKLLYFFLFLVTIPPIVFLCHDFYLFYMAQGGTLDVSLLEKMYSEERPGREFSFAALGYIWTKYSPESYKAMQESVSPETWAQIAAFLTFPASVVTAVIAAALYIVVGAVKLLQYLSEAGMRRSRVKKAKRRQMENY